MSDAFSFPPGWTFANRYRVRRVLDPAGGLYLATDIRHGRTVFLQAIVQPRDAASSAALRRGAMSFATVSHPNLLRVWEGGYEGDPEMFFVVLEHVPGEALWARLRRGPVSEHQAVMIVMRAASGLRALHEAKLLHLAIHPGTILLPDTQGLKLLLDLRAWAGRPRRGAEGEPPDDRTRYASPEQLRGDALTTPASDVFSLAVVGLEMLLGRYPEGINETEGAAGAAIDAWMSTRPALPELGRVLWHALQFDPARRFPDAGELIRALLSMPVRPVDPEWAADLDPARAGPDRGDAEPPAPASPRTDVEERLRRRQLDLEAKISQAGDALKLIRRGRERPAALESRTSLEEQGWLARTRAQRAAANNAPPRENGVVYKVWYATNRRPRTRHGTLTGYGPRMDESVHHGSCDVFVPRSHMIGSLGSAWWKRLLSTSDDRLRLRRVDAMAEAAYWADLQSSTQTLAADERNAVVFIHGYNVSFEAAALRTAQLGFDLNVPGPIAFFSWPSRAGLLGYLMDGAMVEASEGAIAEFLTAFAQNTGAERIHVIAHSMGNRGLLRAAQRIVGRAEEASAVRFTHLILAAPDVTRKLFLELAANYHRLATRTTLYISDRDRALRMSRFLQGERVGYAPPITTCPGVDSIYVANVDRTFMGHSPFAESRPVLNDIHELISHDAPPGERMGLRLSSAPGSEPYWEIMK
jgi:esterase/lipase superfamily enzyme